MFVQLVEVTVETYVYTYVQYVCTLHMCVDTPYIMLPTVCTGIVRTY